MLDGATRDKYELISNLLLQQVTLEQIGAVVGLSPGRITQLKDEPDFQEIYQQRAAAHHLENREFDEGWDAVEKQALGVVLTNLQWNKDPEFALRAAMLSNKANRRTRSQSNQPIPAGNAGARVVINLQPQFITRLQTHGSQQIQDNVIEGQAVEATPQKQVNMLLPSQVESMLFPNGYQKPTEKKLKSAVDIAFDDGSFDDTQPT